MPALRETCTILMAASPHVSCNFLNLLFTWPAFANTNRVRSLPSPLQSCVHSMLTSSIILFASSALAFPYKRYDNSSREIVSLDALATTPLSIPQSFSDYTTTYTQYSTLFLNGVSIVSPIATVESIVSSAAATTSSSPPSEITTTLTQYATITVSGVPIVTPIATTEKVITPAAKEAVVTEDITVTMTQYQTISSAGSLIEIPTATTVLTSSVTTTLTVTYYTTTRLPSSDNVCKPQTITVTESATQAISPSTFVTAVPITAVFTNGDTTLTLTAFHTITLVNSIASAANNLTWALPTKM